MDKSSRPEIDYEALAHEAMRGMVRTVMQKIAKTGLPGEHHFFISFDTKARGATLSKRLREKYPDEMTIVLQHQYTQLLVNDDRFEVTLKFDGIPERLSVPFAAIKVFFDPSVPFGHQFESNETPDLADTVPATRNTGKISDLDALPGEPVPARPAARPAPFRVAGKMAQQGGGKSAETSAIGTSVPGKKAPNGNGERLPDRAPPVVSLSRPVEAGAVSTSAPGENSDASSVPLPEAKVVKLDAFRKK